MTRLRALSALFLSVLASGCDSGEQHSLSGSKQSIVEMPIERSTSSSNTVAADDAMSFVESRLGRQLLENLRWEITDVAIRNRDWTWYELLAGSPPGKLFVRSEKFSVSAQDLAWPVRVSERSIVFECALTKCIKVEVRQTTPDTANANVDKHKERMMEDTLASSSVEMRSSNKWLFSSEEEANRVATAMNHVLQALGARRSQF